MNTAPLMQRIVLLHFINEIPQQLHVGKLQSFSAFGNGTSERLLDIGQEKELVEAFAFLASTTNDPRKIVAVSVEESRHDMRLVVRIAANHGGLEIVQRGLQGLANVLERVARGELEPNDETREALFSRVVALNQNRILARLRSRHATLKCNFKREQLLKPKILLQLCEAIGEIEQSRNPASMPSHCTTLLSDVPTLRTFFLTLEDMKTREARSKAGLRVLLQIVKVCHRIHSQRTLRAALDSTLTLEPGSKTKVLATIAKLSRYWTVPKFLLRTATKYPLFRKIEISPWHLKAYIPPATQPDSPTSQLIDRICGDKRWERALSKIRLTSETQLREWVSREASLDCPVHAEVQLLLHYENRPCSVRPRFIGSSKRACFLCNLIFTLHGGYILPATHGRVYPKWGLPRADDHNFPTARIRSLLEELFNAVQGTLEHEICSVRRPLPPPCESAIFPSAACSYTEQSDSVRNSSATICRAQQDLTEVPTPSSLSSPVSEDEADGTHIVEFDTTHPRPALSQAPLEASGSTPSSNVCHRLHSELNAPDAQHAALSSDSVSVVSMTDTLSNYTVLQRGQRVWSQLHSVAQSITVRSPGMQLTIAFDKLWICQDQDHTTNYVLGVEWLDEGRAHPVDDFDFADVGDLEVGAQMRVDIRRTMWPRVLHIRGGKDIVALTYGPSASLPNIPHSE